MPTSRSMKRIWTEDDHKRLRDGWLQHKIETKLRLDEQHDHDADTVFLPPQDDDTVDKMNAFLIQKDHNMLGVSELELSTWGQDDQEMNMG